MDKTPRDVETTGEAAGVTERLRHDTNNHQRNGALMEFLRSRPVVFTEVPDHVLAENVSLPRSVAGVALCNDGNGSSDNDKESVSSEIESLIIDYTRARGVPPVCEANGCDAHGSSETATAT